MKKILLSLSGIILIAVIILLFINAKNEKIPACCTTGEATESSVNPSEQSSPACCTEMATNLSDQTQLKSANIKTEIIKVSGACGMCKTRIEKASKVEGIESAIWDAKTQLLTLKYDPLKTSTEVVAKKVSIVGHDTEKFKALDNIYNELPGCCKYERMGSSIKKSL